MNENIPSLPACFREVAEIVSEGQLDFESAERVCRISRQAWLTYHGLWLEDHRSCPRQLRESMLKMFRDSQGLISKILTVVGGVEDEKRKLLEAYRQSIEKRQELLEMLHAGPTIEEAAEAVDREIQRRIESVTGSSVSPG